MRRFTSHSFGAIYARIVRTELNHKYPNRSVSRSVNDVVKSLTRNEATLFGEQQPVDEIAPTTPAMPILRGAGAKKTISDLHLPEAAIAVKESINCRDLKELQSLLVCRLGQNSQETRLRYARFIIRWFFADGLDGIARKTWIAYQDDRILADILRYQYLAHENVMGACVAECLFPIEIGMKVPASLFDRFLSSHYAGEHTRKTSQRLKSNLMRLGILARHAREDYELLDLNPSKTSILLLTHNLFARYEPRTIELRNLLANPFWMYLGIKHEDQVRAVFREADAAGCIGKYVVADQLEQITTCFSLETFLDKKVRL